MTRAWTIGGGALTLDRPRIMAIVNVTPDSFSDGGETFSVEAAVARMRTACDDGASVLDVGGESTRPGAARVSASEQIRRVAPVIRAARDAGIGVPISVDTTLADVAEAALNAGARIINDVSAGMEDAAMLRLAAERGAGIVLMHRLRPPERDSYSTAYPSEPVYDPNVGGVVGVVKAFLRERADAAIAAGVRSDAIVVDPGLGFGKSVAQNRELIERIAEFEAIGFPVLSAASRKSFLSAAPGRDHPKDRDAASVTVAMAHARAGVRLFRVHNVQAHAAALGLRSTAGGRG